MAKSSVMPIGLFIIRHLFHTVKTANSSVGTVLHCENCDIVNSTPQQEAGRYSNFKSREEWAAFHEKHGIVGNLGGGTSDIGCSCGADY